MLIEGVNMNTTVKFLILYAIPILSVVGTFGTYMMGYGTRAEGLVRFALMIAILGLVTSCYIAATLVSQFLTNDIIYAGVIFAVLGCILELIAFYFFLFFFKMELGLFHTFGFK